MAEDWRILLIEATINGMTIVGLYTDPVVGGDGEALIAWAEVRNGVPLRPFTIALGETAATGTFEMWFDESVLIRQRILPVQIRPHIDGNHQLFAAHHLKAFLRGD